MRKKAVTKKKSKKRGVKKRLNRFAYLLPRVSSLVFVFIVSMFITRDLENMSRYPNIAMFTLGLLIFLWTLIGWRIKGNTSGKILIILAFAYFFIMWQQVIWANVIVASSWLFVNAILYFLESPDELVRG